MFDGLKLGPSEATVAALLAPAIVGLLDLGHDRQPQSLSVAPALPVQGVHLVQCENDSMAALSVTTRPCPSIP